MRDEFIINYEPYMSDITLLNTYLENVTDLKMIPHLVDELSGTNDAFMVFFLDEETEKILSVGTIGKVSLLNDGNLGKILNENLPLSTRLDDVYSQIKHFPIFSGCHIDYLPGFQNNGFIGGGDGLISKLFFKNDVSDNFKHDAYDILESGFRNFGSSNVITSIPVNYGFDDFYFAFDRDYVAIMNISTYNQNRPDEMIMIKKL